MSKATIGHTSSKNRAKKDGSFILRIGITTAEHKQLKATATAEGRTLNAYLRARLGFSFVPGTSHVEPRGAVIKPTVIEQKEESDLPVHLDFGEFGKQKEYAKEDGWKLNAFGRPIDHEGRVICRNAAGEWEFVEESEL